MWWAQYFLFLPVDQVFVAWARLTSFQMLAANLFSENLIHTINIYVSNFIASGMKLTGLLPLKTTNLQTI